MSGQSKDDLSRFFRRAAQKPDISFNENDWTKLEAMLDKASAKAAGSGSLRKKFIAASIITLIVLSTVTYFVTDPSTAMRDNAVKRSTYSTLNNSTPVESDSDIELQSKASVSSSAATLKSNSHRETSTDNGPTNKTLHLHRRPRNVFDTSMDDGNRLASKRRSPRNVHTLNEPVDTRESVLETDNVEPTQRRNNVDPHEIVLKEDPGDHHDVVEIREVSHEPVASTTFAQNRSTQINTVDEHVADSVRKLVKPVPEDSIKTTSDNHADIPDKPVQHPHWSIVLSLAPDFSSNDLQHLTSPGEAFGVAGYYRITPRLNVFAGVIGSNKKYVSYGKEYKPKEDHYWSKHTNGVLPTEIDGSCFMLEIPVGVQYTALSMKKNRLLVSGMLSNYTMFNESYTYVFPAENPGAAQGWKSKKTTSYPFSVAGLSVSFEHDLSSRLAIGFSPYMKIPLRDMGTWTTMKLYTVGAALTLRYTFQKSKIPVAQPFERSD